MPELAVVGGTTLAGANSYQTASFVKISAVAKPLIVSSGVKDLTIGDYLDIASGASFRKFLYQII